MSKSEFDCGYEAGLLAATQEAVRIVNSHIDRIYPGKEKKVREALVSLEGSLRDILLAQRGLGMKKEQIAALWSASVCDSKALKEPEIITFARKAGLIS